jgi:ubiquinone/menaquinone biosynthesis C-methylase UbiE
LDIDQAKEMLGKQFSLVYDDAKTIIDYLQLPHHAKVLDVGTGHGFSAITLALHGYAVVTGEPEADDSIYARQDWQSNAQKAGVDHLIKFKAFEAQDMPFEDNTFDGIFFFGVLHHIDEKIRGNVLREMVRIAKPKAVICFFEPNEEGMKMVRKHYASHPEAAGPRQYFQGLKVTLQEMKGGFFDAFIFTKAANKHS